MSQARPLCLMLGLGAALALCPLAAGGKGTGDAWNDPRNPVAIRFRGDRLDLWSLKGPVRPKPPSVHDPHWACNPIDAFVLSELERRGLAPSPEADRRTLLRRLTFGLL